MYGSSRFQYDGKQKMWPGSLEERVTVKKEKYLILYIYTNGAQNKTLR